MSDLLNWADKKNSANLEEFIAKYGAEYCLTAEEINQMRDAVNEMAVIQQSVCLGPAEPTDTPAGTGANYWEVIVPGTYTYFGGVALPENQRGLIYRNAAGAFSISFSGLDLSGKLNVSDVIDTLESNEADKPLSAKQGKILKEEVQVIKNVVNAIKQPDGYYFTDLDGNIVAKITDEGLQSVDVKDKEGNSLNSVYEAIKVITRPDGFYFTDDVGYIIAKLTKDGFEVIDVNNTSIITTLIRGLEFYSIGDSLSAANIWQVKLAELTGSIFNTSLNTSTPLSVGGTVTGGVSTTCGQWRTKNLKELNVNPKVIFIENINDLSQISRAGTIDDVPYMLTNIITYPTNFASGAALETWLTDGSFATYLGTFATIDKKIGSGIRFTYTGGTREKSFISKNSAEWTDVSKWVEGWAVTLYSQYKGLLEYMKVEFPTALIMWFAPTRIAIQTVDGGVGWNAALWNVDGSFNMTAYKASSDVVDYETLTIIQKNICQYYGIPFIDVNKESGINPLNFLEYYPQIDVHPLPIGYEKWGETIAKLI